MDVLPAFLSHLGNERRMAARTVEAYGSDLAMFFGFLRLHLGTEPSLKALSGLKARDIRAYLAARRRDGLSDASIARLLSSIKALYRWMSRAHGLENAEIGYLQGPRRAPRLPRPVSIEAAKDILHEAETEPDAEPWIAARDLAVLSLLYGGGLRISEALGLTGADLPAPERLRVSGKGAKVRLVPLIAPVREAINAYGKLCPYALTKSGALFRGARGGPSVHGSSRAGCRCCAACSGCRKPRRRMPCATLLQRTFSPMAQTCARSRHCSVTPRSPRRRSIPAWTQAVCAPCTPPPIRAPEIRD